MVLYRLQSVFAKRLQVHGRFGSPGGKKKVGGHHFWSGDLCSADLRGPIWTQVVDS